MAPIKNTTRRTVISKHCVICRSHWRKARGLMFTLSIKEPLLFFFEKEKRWGLHMLFVFYPIDVIFLDKDRKVVDIKEDFAPFSFYTPKKPCLYIIEGPIGMVKNSRTSLGDRIEF
ncbi:MAG TPA: DUF192 domain-containing protein [Candidatus Nanoarchaeia archaeon]|nr:DUF192 domain-containing protein [Candidatus Nanoarchaeia archaeon]